MAALLGRVLLCEREPELRPCGTCRHCARIVTPSAAAAKKDEPRPFHPDFAVLERDLKTSTSADSAREFLRDAHSSPFEARGQVFVFAEAETLSGEAANALLKMLEEPGLGSPRHFLLLDVQWLTPHLAQFGAIEIPRKEYLARLQEALGVDAPFL